MLDPYFKRAFPTKHLKKWLYWLPIEYWVLRGATRVLFTRQAEADLAKQSFWLHRWNACVTPFGTISPEGDPALSNAKPSSRACPAARNKRFLLFLGLHRSQERLRPAHKRICRRLAARDPELDLVMAGPDPQNWRADSMDPAETAGVANRIHWHPACCAATPKWGAFHASEAFIPPLPSHQENFGIAVAEALACSAPRPALRQGQHRAGHRLRWRRPHGVRHRSRHLPPARRLDRPASRRTRSNVPPCARMLPTAGTICARMQRRCSGCLRCISS